MKRSLITAAALVLLAGTTALAAGPKNYYKSGRWIAYAGPVNDSSTTVCGIHTGGGESFLHIKKFANSPQLVVLLVKTSWRIPEGQKINVQVGFDKNPVGSAEAEGGSLSGFTAGMATIRMPAEDITNFLADFREADKMWIKFPDGNEKTWTVDMTGSRNAADALQTCILKTPVPTQPFSKQNEPETSGTQPFGTPATKKDNGAI